MSTSSPCTRMCSRPRASRYSPVSSLYLDEEVETLGFFQE